MLWTTEWSIAKGMGIKHFVSLRVCKLKVYCEQYTMVTAISANNLTGQFYWPTRLKNPAKYCRECDTCQRFGPVKSSVGIHSILHFSLSALWGWISHRLHRHVNSPGRDISFLLLIILFEWYGERIARMLIRRRFINSGMIYFLRSLVSLRMPIWTIDPISQGQKFKKCSEITAPRLRQLRFLI